VARVQDGGDEVLPGREVVVERHPHDARRQDDPVDPGGVLSSNSRSAASSNCARFCEAIATPVFLDRPVYT